MPGTGACKLCSNPIAGPGLIAGAREDWGYQKAADYGKQYQVIFSEPTWYKHKKHSRTQAQGLISDVETRRREGAITPAQITGTNVDLLEALRDIGLRQVLAPDAKVSMRDILKAVELLEKRRDKKSELGILMKFVTGHAPPVIIIDQPPVPLITEGEVIEVG